MEQSVLQVADPAPDRPAATGRWNRVAVFAGVGVAAALAAASGLGSGGSSSKSGFVLPIVIGVGLVFGVIALTRFTVYVMAMLIMRSSLDLAKLSGHTAGSSTVNAQSRALDPSSILAVLFLVAGIIWLTAQYRHHGRLPGTNMRRALAFFLVACALSVAASKNATASALECLRISAIVVMFAVAEQMMDDPKKMRQILAATMTSAVFPVLYTTYGYLKLHPRTETKGGLGRIVGTFNQSNDFGRYLMLIIIMGAALYPYLERKWRRPLAVSMVLMSAYLFETYTRSALVATAIGLLVVGLLQSKRLVLGLGVVGVVGLMLLPSVTSRFSDLTQFQAKQAAISGTTASGNSLSWRLQYWTTVLPLANSNPVTGIGLSVTHTITDQAKQPHNDFVRAYVETGILGLVAYLSLIVATINLGRRAVRHAPKGTLDYGVAAGFLGCAVAFVLCSAVANVISNVVNLWYFVAFAGAAASVVRRHGPRAIPAMNRDAPMLAMSSTRSPTPYVS